MLLNKGRLCYEPTHPHDPLLDYARARRTLDRFNARHTRRPRRDEPRRHNRTGEVLALGYMPRLQEL